MRERVIIVGVDPGRPDRDLTVTVTAYDRAGEIFVVSVDNLSTSHPPPGTLTMVIAKQDGDTIRAPRSGGPPPHTLKNYSRKRSNR